MKSFIDNLDETAMKAAANSDVEEYLCERKRNKPLSINV